MKKIIFPVLIFISLLIFTQTAKAQVSVGAGVLYGFELERAGVRADGVYTINDTFRAAADIGFFFPETAEEEFLNYKITINWLVFNANMHYLFVYDETWNVYGIAGINYFRYSIQESHDDVWGGDGFDREIRSVAGKGTAEVTAVTRQTIISDVTNSNGSKYSSSETGLNLGIGAEYKISFGSIFGELTYAGVGGDADQLVLGAGVRYNF